jgi:branched-chain amino acid transport system permease protein
LGAAALGLPFVLGEYWAYVAALAYLNVLQAVGLNFLLGYAGQFSFGHSALYGVGAYTTGLLMLQMGLSFGVAIVLGVAATVLLSFLIAFPALRVSGMYLGIITVGFVELFVWVANTWRSVTFGPSGFSVPMATLLGFELNAARRTYYVILPVTIAAIAIARWIIRSKVGRALVAIRDHEAAAQALGVDPVRYKLLAFVLNGAYAGLAGGMYAILLNYVSPGSFGLFEAIAQFNMLVIGGIGTLYGPILGALGVTVLFELLRSWTGLQELLSGLFLVIFILYLPSGVVGGLRLWGWLPPEQLRGASALEAGGGRRHRRLRQQRLPGGTTLEGEES